jgi:hypothetical protein
MGPFRAARRTILRHSRRTISRPTNDVAAARNIPQENRGHPQGSPIPAEAHGWNLHCTGQKQVCIYFGQKMISF